MCFGSTCSGLGVQRMSVRIVWLYDDKRKSKQTVVETYDFTCPLYFGPKLFYHESGIWIYLCAHLFRCLSLEIENGLGRFIGTNNELHVIIDLAWRRGCCCCCCISLATHCLAAHKKKKKLCLQYTAHIGWYTGTSAWARAHARDPWRENHKCAESQKRKYQTLVYLFDFFFLLLHPLSSSRFFECGIFFSPGFFFFYVVIIYLQFDECVFPLFLCSFLSRCSHCLRIRYFMDFRTNS